MPPNISELEPPYEPDRLDTHDRGRPAGRLVGDGASVKTAKSDELVAQAGPQAPAAAPVSDEPQQTSASFGDWMVRCAAAPQAVGKRVCEAAQSVVINGQQSPIAQIAFGYQPLNKGADPTLTLTVLLPVSIAFDKSPRLAGPDEAQAATLTFRRCRPGGCLADAKPDPAMLKDRREASKPGHLTFTDAAERTISMPISFRGLAQALDHLAKQMGKQASR